MSAINRRNILFSGAAAACAAGAGLSVSLLAKQASHKGLLRPPGALEEKDFLASCIKCGQCIQVCPYHSLKLLDLASGINMGTPVIQANERGCYLCDLFPCILCCPSGALDARTEKIEDVHMGVAWVHSPERCWATQKKTVSAGWIRTLQSHGGCTELEVRHNKRLSSQTDTICRLCEAVCPVPNKAAAIVIRNNVPVIGRQCVGCGACAEVCPEQIIEIKARQTFDALYGTSS